MSVPLPAAAPPFSASSCAAPTGIRCGDRLASKNPNASASRTSGAAAAAAAASHPAEARSVVTGESGSAHAEANASGDRASSDQPSGGQRRPGPNSRCLSRVSLMVTLQERTAVLSASRRCARSSRTAGCSQVPAPLLGPSGPRSGRYQTFHPQHPLRKRCRVLPRAGRLAARRQSDRRRGERAMSGRRDAPERSRVKRSVRSEEPAGETSPASLPRGRRTASGRVLSK